MKRIILICFLLVSANVNLFAQKDFPKLTGPYLGQRPPGMTPEIFAPGIISTNMNAAKIVFSPDGKEIVFRLMNYNHSFYTIVFMRQENGVWSKPEVAPFSGKYHDTDPYFSLDGKQLFFGSNRPLEGQKAPKDPDIWVVERKESGWSTPVNLGFIVNSDKGDVNPAVSQNRTLYFASNRDGGRGNHDIYMSKLINGKYAQPENLGDAINTSFTESGPYIAPDESYIIFNRYSSDTGNGLYISFRNNDGSWSKAINMGKKINTENDGMHGFHGFVSPDSKYLFFTSDRNPYFPHPDHNLTYDEIVKIFNSPLNGSYNIYWVDARIIEELKPKKNKLQKEKRK
jgi:Tol biopolymer transport system component